MGLHIPQRKDTEHVLTSIKDYVLWHYIVCKLFIVLLLRSKSLDFRLSVKVDQFKLNSARFVLIIRRAIAFNPVTHLIYSEAKKLFTEVKSLGEFEAVES